MDQSFVLVHARRASIETGPCRSLISLFEPPPSLWLLTHAYTYYIHTPPPPTPPPSFDLSAFFRLSWLVFPLLLDPFTKRKEYCVLRRFVFFLARFTISFIFVFIFCYCFASAALFVVAKPDAAISVHHLFARVFSSISTLSASNLHSFLLLLSVSFLLVASFLRKRITASNKPYISSSSLPPDGHHLISSSLSLLRHASLSLTEQLTMRSPMPISVLCLVSVFEPAVAGPLGRFNKWCVVAVVHCAPVKHRLTRMRHQASTIRCGGITSGDVISGRKSHWVCKKKTKRKKKRKKEEETKSRKAPAVYKGSRRLMNK